MSDIEPKWVDRTPVCVESCPSHDGKCCMVTGCRPDNFCEPAIQRMHDAIATTRDRLVYLQELWGSENITKRVTDCLSQAIEEVV